MRTCFQFRTQDVLAHGEAVREHYLMLLEAAQAGGYPPGWRMPKWWGPERAHELARRQPPADTMARYLRYHDCGKPQCRTVDSEGRQHFEGHAQASADLWQALGGHPDEVWLMRHDMVLHRGSAEECQVLAQHPLFAGLLLAALAEVHANAVMFGGMETDSFKAKIKKLERRGAAWASRH